MDHNLTERQINLPIGNINNEQNGLNGHTNISMNLAFAKGLSMSNRDPVDLQFKDVTYTVNLGFGKGKHIPMILFFDSDFFFTFVWHYFYPFRIFFSRNFYLIFGFYHFVYKRIQNRLQLSTNVTTYQAINVIFFLFDLWIINDCWFLWSWMIECKTKVNTVSWAYLFFLLRSTSNKKK